MPRPGPPGNPCCRRAHGPCRFQYTTLGGEVVLKILSQFFGPRTAADQAYDAFLHFYYNSGRQILETRETASKNDAPDSENPEVQYVCSVCTIDAPTLRDRDDNAGGVRARVGRGDGSDGIADRRARR